MRRRTAIFLIASMLLMMTACSQNSAGPINDKNTTDVIEETAPEETEEEKKAREEAEKAEKEAEEAARKEAEEAAKREAEEAARLAELQAEFDDGMGYWFAINDHPYDMDKAFESFTQAAEGGYADAWYWLGVLTKYGVDVDRWPKVAEYYEKAWEEGSAWGLYGQGTLYDIGLGYEKDYDKAMELYSQSVEEGCAMGYYGIGGLYEAGKGVEKDGVKAIEYYEKAVESVDWLARNAARVSMGDIYLYGMDDVEKDVEKARELNQQAIDEDFGMAYSGMGTCYDPYSVDDENTDYETTFSWFLAAADKGWTYNLAICYLYALGTEQDAARGIELLKQQENGGWTACDSLAGLAGMYANGRGVEKNVDLAVEYAYKSIDAATYLEEDIISEDYGYGFARRLLRNLRR